MAVIRFPSIEGFFSTLPNSSRAASTSCMTLRPSSMWASSRPRNKTLTRTLSFCSRNSCGTLDLDLDVVVARLGPDPNFLDVDLMLLLLGELFLLRVLEFAVVDDFADGRTLVGSDFDEVQTSLASRFQSFARRHDPEHHALGIDDPHGGDADLLVHPHTAFDRSDSVLLGDEETEQTTCLGGNPTESAGRLRAGRRERTR